MLEGAIIFVIGLLFGYFFVSPNRKEKFNSAVKKVISNQKGIIVDLTPPVDLGEPPQNEEIL